MSIEKWHGTPGGYTNRRCRCAQCKGANKKAQLKFRERRYAERIRVGQRLIHPDAEHGSASSYTNYGCRCLRCVDAHAKPRRRPRLSRGAADLIGTHVGGSQDWHDVRSTGIGGSDIAAILGLSPWESAFSLWHRKAGLVGRKPVNAEMDWGHRHEDTIAQWYRDTHPGARLSRTGTWRNRDRPWQLANPDRLMSGRRVLEIKTDRSADGWGEPGTDEIPIYYRCQVLWYLDTLGWDEAHVAVLIGLSDAREYILKWNADEAAVMRDAAQAFWQSIRDGARPPLDGHDATYRAVRELNPDLEDTEVELPVHLAERYHIACGAEKAAVLYKREVVSQVLDHMGTARRAVCEGERVAIRVPGRDGAPPSLRPSPATKTTGQRIGDAA